MIGTKLANRYEITREIGRGGMGVVYLARDPVLDREVAVKVITPDMVSPESAERFRREARVVAKMDHPAIVNVYDSGEHDGALFFVMPFVDGTNLRSILRGQNLRLGDLIDIGIQTAEALEYSHAHAVVHRDVKPENIMVSKSGESVRVRVTDFGLAMVRSQDRLTKTATVVGTIAYMSPEQVSGKEVDARSDIYSLGTVLYECLVGQTPFAGEVQALVYRISHEIPVSPKALIEDVDDDLEEIIMRCLEKDPAKRPVGREITEVLSKYRMKLQSSGRNRMMLPSSTTMSFQIQRAAARPFVGRDKEFAELQRRLNASLSGECQFVLLAGEAGIGKTRLLEELETLAKVRLISVLHGRFVELSHPLPYQGYCEAIQEYFRSRAGAEAPIDFSDLAADLVSLFPVLAEIKDLSAHSGESVRPLPESGAKKFEDRTYIFELLARTLTRMAAGKPFVLLLEDLHAADVSIEALDYIVRRLGPTPTLIVGTYRTTEVDKRHPITNLLSGFKGDKRFTSIQLGPLSASNHRLFLERMIGGAGVEDDLAHRIFEATEGNPYFTAELMRSLMDAGGIVKDETGVYKLSSETAISVEELPVTIQQTVEERIERLPKELREVLSTAAVLGKTFEFAHLETLASEAQDLENSIEQLIRLGFIEEDRQSRSDRLSFSSGMVRDVLYASLPRRRRRTLHRKHAEELERRNTGRLERVYPLLFDHYGQGDVPEKVVEYGMLLAKKSLESFSPDDAIRVLQTVLDFLEEEDATSLAVAQAKTLLASAFRMAGNIPGALEQLESAASVYEKQKQSSPLLQTVQSAVEIAWQGRKIDDTRKWLERGIDLAQMLSEVPILTKLLSLAATVANMRGEYRKARQYLEEVERLRPSREESREEVVHGGTLVVAVTNPCRARHPVEAIFNEESEIWSNVFETLVSIDSQGNLVSELCERWETISDGAVFRFELRKDVRLHNGKPLTATDVKQALEAAIQRSSHATLPGFAPIQGVSEFLSGTAANVSGIVDVSENVIRIELRERLPIYPALLTDSRSAIAVKANEGAALIGTGPFKTALLQPDVIALERNEHYWKGTAPLIDRIEFRVGLNSTEVAEGFRSGKYDLARDLLPADLDEILRDQQLKATLVEAPKKNVYFVCFNTFSPVCGIPLVRKAMADVIRVHDLVRSTLGRFAEPAQGLLPPGILGYDPGRRRHSTSREQAAGWIASAELKTPVRLKASVHPLMQDRYSSLLKDLLKAWSDIGIEIDIQTPDIKSYNDSFEFNEGFDLLIGRWIADYDDPDALTYSLFHSEIGEFRNYYHSKDFDHLAEQARTETAPDQREKLYRKLDSFPKEVSFLLPLFHEIDYRVANPKVRKLELSSISPYVNYSRLAKVESADAQDLEAKSERGSLTVPIYGSLTDLDPSLAGVYWQVLVVPTMFETLTGAAEGAGVKPWLASGFQAEDGARKFRFYLREGVRFHDGRRLTARDVRYSFEHLLQNKETQYSWLLSPIRGAKEILNGQAKELAGFKIVSALEFVVELDQPLSFFPALLAYTATSIIPEGAERFSGSWREGCVGTGPFRVVSFDPGHTLKVEANPDYWRPGFPKLEFIDFQFGISSAESLAGFKSGRYSIAWDLLPADVEALLHEPEYAAQYFEIPNLITYYLVLNVHMDPTSDPAVRHRLIDSLNVASLTRRNIGRLAIPANSLTPTGLLGYEPPPRTIAPSPAKKSVAEFELSVMLHSVYESRYAGFTRELFQNIADRGFRINTVETKGEFLPAAAYPSVHVNLTRWVADYPDADTFMYYLLHSRNGVEGSFCGNADLDRMLEKGRTESDPLVRQAIYKQVEEIIRTNALLLPLFHEQAYCFARPKVEGLELNFFHPYLSYEKMWIRK